MTDTFSSEFHLSSEELTTLQKLTREYAKFSRDAVGLGHAFGGVLVFLLVFLLGRNSLSPWEGILLGTTPFIWIITKESLRRNYYQFSGRVTQPARRWHDLILGILAGIIAAAIIAIFLTYRLTQAISWSSTTVCIAVLLAMPFLAWRYLRAPYEFVTGIFLLALSAFLLSGNLQIATRVAGALGIVAGIVALVMILAGYAEHMKFLKLRREMRPLKEQA